MRSNNEILELIKNLCIEKDISLSELARRVDMAKSAVSRYFNGTRQFPLNRIDDFARALNTTPEYLLDVTPVIDNLTTDQPSFCNYGDTAMFAKNLKYLRQLHNIDQLQLAKALVRKSASSISEWESGKYTPKIGVLSMIASYFNVNIDDMMTKDLELENSTQSWSWSDRTDTSNIDPEAVELVRFLSDNTEYKELIISLKDVSKEDLNAVKVIVDRLKDKKD